MFCGLSETIFHVLTECRRLKGFFCVLTEVLNHFNINLYALYYVFSSKCLILFIIVNKNVGKSQSPLETLEEMSTTHTHTNRHTHS